MADRSKRREISQEIMALSVMKAVLATEGAAEMVDTAATTAFRMLMGSKSLKGVIIQGQAEGFEIDVYLNVKFGTAIPQTAWNIQENVKAKIESLTETPVRKVDVHISGVV